MDVQMHFVRACHRAGIPDAGPLDDVRFLGRLEGTRLQGTTMPISRHLILPRGLLRPSDLPPHPLPGWPDVRCTLADLGLTVTRVPGGVTLTTPGDDPLYMAGGYPTTKHVIHRLMAVTTRMLARAVQLDAALTGWRNGDDVVRNQIEVWADNAVRNVRGGPFDAAAIRRIRRAMQVSALPADWLTRLPDLAGAHTLGTPLRTELRAVLLQIAREALDGAVPGAEVMPPERRRL